MICGRADRLTPVRESVRLAERIRGARLEIVPGGGHMLMLEEPDRLEELVLGAATDRVTDRVTGRGADAPGAAAVP